MSGKTCYTVANMSNGASSFDSLSSGAARWLSRLGMSAPAVFLLELHRPFSFVASQSILFLQPLLGAFAGDESLARAVRWLDEGEGVRALIERLEAGE